MKVLGIVSEYNPFHNGHQFQIEKAKNETGAEFVVAIMSGNFTQRGEIAIFDKQKRAKAALLNGVDLVLELPYFYALSSAEFFATGAVKILNKLGIITNLSFGSECGDLNLLSEIANLILKEETQNEIKLQISKGFSIFKAIENVLPLELQSVMSTPNNILAIEYLKALRKIDSAIIPHTIKREKVSYHSLKTQDDFASATAIREKIINANDYERFVPKSAFEIYKNSDFFCEKNIERAIIYALRINNSEYFKSFSDVSEGLHNLISSCANKFDNLEEIILNIKSKRYSYTRIRRIIYNIFLNIDSNLRCSEPEYVKVLGFNENGNKLLNKLKETSEINVITNIKKEMLFTHPSLKIDKHINSVFSLGSNNISNNICTKTILPKDLI